MTPTLSALLGILVPCHLSKVVASSAHERVPKYIVLSVVEATQQDMPMR